MGYYFDGINKIISIDAQTTVSVRDLWSRYIDWYLTSDNSKYPLAFRTVGGDEISSDDGTQIPIYSYLINSWRIKPMESNHTLNIVDGILLVDGGGDPFVNTAGAFTVRINFKNPVQAITVATGGGGGSGGGNTPTEIANAVWNAQLDSHSSSGSFGSFIKTLLTLGKFLGSK